SNQPPQVVSGISTASYSPTSLANGTTYFWQVVARNSGGATTGPVWSFTTATTPPATPTAPNPATGATNVATDVTLTWSSSGATSYDVLFGSSDPPSQVATALSTASYTPAGPAAGTTYFWQIGARNAAGTTAGPVWSFTTAAATPPAVPNSPHPADGALNVALNTTLTWSSAGATTYDVNFGTTNPPAPAATAQS